MNIFDDEKFFDEYSRMSRSMYGLEAAGEWHQFREMLPNMKDKSFLDLGCGYGWHCEYAAENGATEVIGIDSSKKMLNTAKAMQKHSNIEYLNCGIEDYDYPEAKFDLVISNLVLHYVEDLENIYRKVLRTLKSGGEFVFNIEHPAFTAGVNQQWITDDKGNNLYWPVDNYYYPGKRTTDFLGCEVVKYHHTLSQIINPLIKAGFIISEITEAYPPENMMDIPDMKDEMRRPMMLLIKAVKP